MGTVERLKERFKKLDSDRSDKLTTFQEIAEYFQPEKADFFGSSRDAEDRLKIFDSTPEEVLQNLAAALHSFLTSPVHTWFSLGLVVNAEDASDEVKEWIDLVVSLMMAKFNSEEGGFQSAVHELWLDLPAFGIAVFFVDERDGIRFKCFPLSEFCFSENSKGVIDVIFRSFEMTAAQMFEVWKDKVSSEVKKTLEEHPDKKFKIIHAVEPRLDFKPGSKKSKELPFRSIYFEDATNKILIESGYEECPYMVPRWGKSSGQVWGRGPGHKALPDVRVLNELSRSEMIAVDKASDPAVALPHDAFITDFESGGGALNYHRATGDIREKILEMGSNADLKAIEASIIRKQDAIKRMFLNHKLQMVGGPQKTAEEVREIVKQNMTILGPVAGRLQSEFLAPLVNRVFNIMLRNGELPPPPEELKGQIVKVQYVSPISRAQKQTDADAVRDAFNFLAPFAQVDPSIMKNFDLHAMARDTQELFGYKAKYLKSPDQIKKEDQAAQAQAAQQQQVAEQSQQLALAQQAKELRTNE